MSATHGVANEQPDGNDHGERQKHPREVERVAVRDDHAIVRHFHPADSHAALLSPAPAQICRWVTGHRLATSGKVRYLAMNRSFDADRLRRTALAVAFVLLSTAAAELGAMGMWTLARSGFEWKVPLLLGGAAALLVVALIGLQRVLTGNRPSRLLALGVVVLGSVVAGVVAIGG